MAHATLVPIERHPARYPELLATLGQKARTSSQGDDLLSFALGRVLVGRRQILASRGIEGRVRQQ